VPLAHGEGVGHIEGGRYPDAFGLEIGPDRILSVLMADAAAFMAAERRHIRYRSVGIDPDRPGLQPLRHREGAAHILRPHSGGEAVIAVIADSEGLFLVVEGDHRENRAENLL